MPPYSTRITFEERLVWQPGVGENMPKYNASREPYCEYPGTYASAFEIPNDSISYEIPYSLFNDSNK